MKKAASILLSIAFLLASAHAQTSQTINFAPIQLQPLSVGGIQIPLGFISVQPITVTFPKAPVLIAGAGVTIKTNAPNVWTISAGGVGSPSVNATNWTFVTVTQTNIQNIWVTNVLPNYIANLTVLGEFNVTNGITIHTNHP